MLNVNAGRIILVQFAFLAGSALALEAQEIPCKSPDLSAAKKLDPSTTKAPPHTADLPSVVASVEAAINCYQANRGLGTDALPPLSSVLLEFKTTTGTVGGLTLSIFIFKLGASHEKDTINDLSLTYALKPSVQRGNANKAPRSLSDSLANGILAAASAVKAAPTVSGLPVSKVSVNVQFGIKNDGNISLNIPVQLVTLGPSYDRNKNDTQSVTLTFGQDK
jgi:hypothetical protein